MIGVVSLVLSVPVAAAWSADDDRCSESRMRAVTSRILAAALGADPDGAHGSNEDWVRKNVHPETRLDPLMGGVVEISDRNVIIGIAAMGCFPVSFSRPDCEPEKWARIGVFNGLRRLKTPEELRAEYVRMSEDEAFLRAVEVAAGLVGEVTYAELELVEGGLRDEGDSLVYHYRWKREEVEDGLRVGLRVLTVRVNPATGCVFEASFLSSQPNREGLVTGDAAMRTAVQAGSKGESRAPCALVSGSLVEEFVDSTHSNKYWAFVVECQENNGSVGTANVRIDASTGDVVEHHSAEER
jgi:hypothetical protein